MKGILRKYAALYIDHGNQKNYGPVSGEAGKRWNIKEICREFEGNMKKNLKMKEICCPIHRPWDLEKFRAILRRGGRGWGGSRNTRLGGLLAGVEGSQSTSLGRGGRE